ncbi:MAG: hypothetical protein JEZ11_26750 [Desulfobacterales bacterium]|nr:hypothetical protein [Desulfobacterales bacterium]
MLEETDRLFACEFCRVRSYLLPQLFFRYMLPHGAPPGKDLFYYPYWRFKGMTFACGEGGITHRFVDASLQGIDSPHFPLSLGLRSQAMRLSFVPPETPGRFLKPTVTFKAIGEIFDERFQAEGKGHVFHRAQIGETISLIYAPFYTNAGRIFDAVLNRPLAETGDNPSPTMLPGGKPAWRTRFVPNLCPGCGWDLQGQSDSLILTCGNCDSVWKPTAEKLVRLHFGHLPKDGHDICFLPFWRIRADVQGYPLATYTDMVRLANLPKVPQPSWNEIPFRFWAPAFKLRPQTLIHLSRSLTLTQPQDEPTPSLPSGRLFPVTLPVKEAVESLMLCLASFVKPPKNMLPRLSDAKLTPKRFLLVYVPFVEGHHEYIQPEMKISINKNQLALSGNL